MARKILSVSTKIITWITTFGLIVASLYASYALWDNHQIYARAENITNEFKGLINDTDFTVEETGSIEIPEETQVSKGKYADVFVKWQAINPDINGWITMDGTQIDYPILQGATNLDYISTDPYGKVATVGSIFLDFRNDRFYNDQYNLLYGHNMSEHRMFSDVNLYKEENFFYQNQTGMLYLPDRDYHLKTISVILTNSSDTRMFNPNSWISFKEEQILDSLENEAILINEAGLNAVKTKLENGENVQILALSTCSSEFTEARTILLTLMDPDNVVHEMSKEAVLQDAEETDKAER